MNTPVSDELTQELAKQQIERFVARFEPSYRYLACHCALPLVLTPELVNYIRVQFLLNQEVPWIAEADLLLSELCRPVGYELYAMSSAVRSNLLAQFEEPEFQQQFGTNRLKSVAQLLMDYVTYLMRTHPASQLQAQRWAAMVYLDEHRTQAEEEIASALQALVNRGKNGQAELGQLQRLIEEFKPQLSQYSSLLDFAKSLGTWLKGQIPPDARQSYTVHGVKLRLPSRSQQGKHYAIALGINQYSKIAPTIPTTAQYPVRDVAVMQQWFSGRGFEEVHLLTDRGRLLNDILLSDFDQSETTPFFPATQAGWEEFWRTNFFPDSLSAEDTLWFFFSGYGVYREGQDYLFLADSDWQFPEKMPLPLVELVKKLQRSGAGQVILLLDADRDRYQPTTKGVTSNKDSSLEQQLREVLTPEKGLIIFYATSPEQGAYEIDLLQQGSFTHALREALLSTQGNLSLERLGQFLQDRVTELNEQHNRRTQTPQHFIFPPALQKWIPFPSNLQVFEYTTPTVNRRGETIKQDTQLGQSFTENLDNGVTLEMVAISGGTFLMGSPKGEGNDDERPQHEVTLQPFFMGKYPVTQAQYQAVMGENPAHFKDRSDSDRRPVEQVDWHDANEFCKRLSKLTGRDYRLPSEAEWEYACRAGTTTPFHFGETITDQLANYDASETYADEPKGEYREQTAPVASFLPNAFGLYDMHGNVWEWCADTWHDDYKDAPTDGSAWTKGDNDNRSSLRGGSWYDIPNDCRSAFRDDSIRERGFIDDLIGFRVVYVAGRTP